MPIRQHYLASHKRLFLVDYDGTLVGFTDNPDDALPTAAALDILKTLSADSRNTVAVVSGRDCEFMDQTLGKLPISLVAEHGLYFRDRSGTWHPTVPLNQDWKPAVRHILESAQVPGSFIEEKSMGLVWHYRRCEPAAGEHAAAHLITDLELLAEPELKVADGSKVVEVSIVGVDKGQAARHWLEQGEYDFILAAGDDTTDEDLFQSLPATAHKVKVGAPSPSANLTVADPVELLELLRDLAH
jgi:trehalose 6-phosphate synthase/phosphatase